MVCTSNSRVKRDCNSDPLRQLHSNSSSKAQHFNDIPPRDDLGINLEKSSRNEMDTINLTHTGKVQRVSRPVEQEYNSVNRMGTFPKGFSKNHFENEPKTTGGLVRHKSKSPTEIIHITLPRRRSRRNRCNENQLEQVGTPISVSPDQIDFEGFGETSRNSLRECDSGNTRYSNTTMVYGPTTSESSINTSEYISTTVGGRQIGKNTEKHQASRLEIITAAYNKQFPDCPEAVSLMAAPLRESSINDYQQKWKTFLGFLGKNKVSLEEITIGNVLQFFTYLFYEKHRRPGTVAHYRTALTIPLKMYCQIDLRIQAVADLLRSMNLQRPIVPV